MQHVDSGSWYLAAGHPELALVLSGTHLPTLEGLKSMLAQQHYEVVRSGGRNSQGNRTQVAGMVAQWSTHYATAV